MDGVKISVNKEGDDSASKRRGRPKKTARTVAAEARPSSQSSSAKEEKKSKSSSKGGGFMSMLTIVIVTAVVVGGAIYFWQNRNTEKSISSVQEDARKVRVDFEQRMEQLKNKLSGVESENQKLKDSAKELEDSMGILKGAKLEFNDEELGIFFEYPAVLGEVKLEKSKGSSGNKFRGTFSKNEKLVFGGVSKDYVAAASGTASDFLDTSGYMEKGGKFYYQPAGMSESTDYEFKPAKTAGKAFMLDKNSFVPLTASSTKTVDIGENSAAIAKLEKGNYTGVAFLNQDFTLMPLENFESMLKSIEVNK